MEKWRIGCSGFSYKHWKNSFYPKEIPQRKWFEFYCESFNTVELNVTFYRMPQLEVFKGWHSRSPADFKFTVKVPRLITHFKKFNNVYKQLNDFYHTIGKGLPDKLGCVLFQLPPTLPYTEEMLDKIVGAMDISFNNVVEFRHVSWWRKEVYDVFKQQKLSFSGISYPGLPEEICKTAPLIYYRFHGVPQLYRSPYENQELELFVKRIDSYRGIKNVYAYFNNDIAVAAVKNAKQLQVITSE